MKSLLLALLVTACHLAWPASIPAQAQVSPVLSAKPELDQLLSAYEAEEKTLDLEIEPQLKAAQDLYTTEMEAIKGKYNQNKRPEVAGRIENEAKRYAMHGMSNEPSGNLPPEMRTAWATLLRSTTLANQSVTLKRNAARTRFTQALTPLVQGYRAKNDLEGILLARRAYAAVTLRSAIEADRLAVTQIVGNLGEVPWQDVAKEGGYVVGFDVGRGQYYQWSVLGSLKPIYATARALRDGKERGMDGGQRVIAKEGYAVGGLHVCSGGAVDAVQIIFMAINPDGITLNPREFYVSDWLGGDHPRKPVELSGKGRMVVGVTGYCGGVVDSIGLIYVK